MKVQAPHHNKNSKQIRLQFHSPMMTEPHLFANGHPVEGESCEMSMLKISQLCPESSGE